MILNYINMIKLFNKNEYKYYYEIYNKNITNTFLII